MEDQGSIATLPATESAQEAKKKEIARFTNKKGKRRKVALLLALVAVAGGSAWYFTRPKDITPRVPVAELAAGELVRQISLTGRLESEQASRIYSTQTALIHSVGVKVGDRVEAGDILAEIDTSDLVRKISAQQSIISNAAKTSEIKLSMTQEDYENMMKDLEAGNYTDLVKAEQNLIRAQKNYTERRSDFEDHRDQLDQADEDYDRLDRAMTRAEIAMNKAESALKAAEREGDDAKIEAARKDFNEKEATYNEARDKWEEAYDDKDEVYDPITMAYREARLDYLEAVKAKELADRDSTRALDSLKNQIELGELGQDLTAEQLTLEQLQRDLSECTVKAPVSGVVTAVYAKEGMPGNGLLFVVEDIEKLVVKTEVKEYDVASLREGMESVIKSESLNDKTFAGEVSRIAPAAIKNEFGETKTDSTAAFETEIALLEADEGLRVGMKVRLNVIIERKQDVFSVPFEAVTTDADGNDIIYIMREEQGQADSGTAMATVARAVRVTTGMETDFALEISSDEIKQGDRVISDPTGVTDGMAVLPLEG